MMCRYFHPKTIEERREAYKVAKEAGFNSGVARRLRDWRIQKVKLFIVYQDVDFWNKIYTKKMKGGVD